MQVSSHSFTKLMQMAQLSFSPGEQGAMREELSSIMDWVAKLQEVDTKGIAPLITMSVETNRFHPDTPDSPLPLSSALANAPKHDGTYFHVPTSKKPDKNA